MEEKSVPEEKKETSRPFFVLPLLPAGIHEQSIPKWDGERPLRFTLSVPKGYTNKRAVPLIVVLHFGGEATPFYGKNMLVGLVAPVFEELGSIMIAPDSLMGDWRSTEDEEAVLFLMNCVKKTYNIDSQKVLVTGYSLGGIGTWHFAWKYPELFTAAIPLAGVPCPPGDWQTPICAIHSLQDEVIPIESTRKRIEQLKSQGVNARIIIVKGISHYATFEFQEPLKQTIPWLKEVWR